MAGEIHSRALRAAANAALVLVSLCLVLGVMEIVVRKAYPRYDPSGHVTFPNDIGGVEVGPANTTLRMTKNTGDYDVTVRFNEAGLRDSTLRTAGDSDIYFVGDSFTFGWGVEEEFRFSNVVGKLLNRRTRNLAVPTDVEGYRTLVDWGIQHGARPHRLVVGLCMENDVYDYDLADANGVEDGDGPFRRMKGAIAEHSALYVMFTTTVQQSPVLRRTAEALHLAMGNYRGMWRAPYERHAIETTIERIRRVTNGYNATILMIPSRGLWVGTDAERADARRIHEEILVGLRSLPVKVVDVRPVLEAGGQPMQYHFRSDPHWNTAGHAIAAHLLAAALR